MLCPPKKVHCSFLRVKQGRYNCRETWPTSLRSGQHGVTRAGFPCRAPWPHQQPPSFKGKRYRAPTWDGLKALTASGSKPLLAARAVPPVFPSVLQPPWSLCHMRGILGTLGDEKAVCISCSSEFFYLQGEASGDVEQCTDPLQALVSKCREAKKSAYLRGDSCDDLQ